MKKTTTARKTHEAPEADPRFAPVVDAFAEDRQVTCGKMMGSLGLKVNGRIFAMLVRGDLVAKLPKERVDELVSKGRGDRFDPRRDGRLMKEWVVVGVRRANWVGLAKEAHRFVKGGKA